MQNRKVLNAKIKIRFYPSLFLFYINLFYILYFSVYFSSVCHQPKRHAMMYARTIRHDGCTMSFGRVALIGLPCVMGEFLTQLKHVVVSISLR